MCPMPIPLSSLLRDVPVLSRSPGTVSGIDPDIRGITYDSRAVKPGFLFFALPGAHDDGRRFIGDAISRGAAAVVLEPGGEGSFPPGPGKAALVLVESARLAMAPAARSFHGDPSKDLLVLGVTGTEGKSTTVSLISQLLELSGTRTGFISTVEHKTGASAVSNPEHQTTPEAPAVQAALAAMREAGAEAAVLEASSHGLSPRLGRLAGVSFDVGVFMNVTHEHLEFHGDFARYRDDKANLFRALDREPAPEWAARKRALEAIGVVNGDDPSAPYFRAATKRKILSFGWRDGVDLRASELEEDDRGSSFSLSWKGLAAKARIELPGSFNVMNAMAALISAAACLGKDPLGVAPLLPSLKPVRGRMTSIEKGQAFSVVVDYAHTPSSFMAVIPPLRERCRGRLILLFGSGGERDVEKRPMQGRIAADYADLIILADEDPRGEDPAELLGMIAAGCPERRLGEDVLVIPNRPSAIREAFSRARPGDTVALLGKGHENSIIGRGGAVPYDEIGEAEKALEELGFDGKPRTGR
jgi:UDP-N-acetylmuramoyl-L-alanyl-D-glutamate--2,6-diaminopimelate ligase